ncbi:MAG TPA: amino acid adenylation domain-containing protein [Thermoanaerobaculia bacterium]|nr:amino acid adenylation domain-containing protein [Thermoanaerobaculia bacterium]
MSGDSRRVTELSADQLRSLVGRIKKDRVREDAAIRPRPAGAGPLPLSFAQERLWFLDQLGTGRASYNIPEALRLTGRLDVEALRLSLEEIVRRHESLRTTFSQEGGSPFQVVSPAARLALPLTDLAALPALVREAELVRLAGEEARKLFDLEAGPLVRVSLLRLGESEHVLLLAMHHVVADGWSMGILVRELGALYTALSAGSPSPLPELRVQYADFALWQRERFRRELLQAEAGWWRQRLAGLPESLDLPTDRPHSRAQSSRGGRVPLVLGSEPSEALAALAVQRGGTLFMALLAGLQGLLARYTGQTDLAVGSPIAGRNRPEVANLIGCFVNTLVLRVDAGGDPSFHELFGRVRQSTLGAYEHQDLPFEKVVEAAQPERLLGRSPLFQILTVLQSAPLPPLSLPGLEIAGLPIHSGTAKFDLTVSWMEEETGLAGALEYSVDLFEPATVERMAGHLGALLAGAAAVPEARLSELPLLTPAESRQLLVEWSASGPAPVLEGAEEVLHRLFEAQAARTPGAEALVAGADRLTYAELDARASRLARRLRGLGVGPESPVAVLLERSADLVTALLAVLKAGGAYVPLDPAYPHERIAFALEDTGARVVLTREALAVPLAALPAPPPHVLSLGPADFAGEDGAEPGAMVDPESLAYVIYTSGSTGRPKGVAIRHGAAAARVAWAARTFGAEDLAGVLASTSVCFDLSVFELFVPLSLGGRIILAANALELPSLPAAGEVTLVNTVPSAMAELVRAGQVPPSVRSVNLAGEPLPRALADAIHGLGTVSGLFNLYGPSEDTTYSTEARVEPGSERAPVIGRPLPGTRAYVVDRDLRPQPAGVPGELLLGGVGLARGYLNRPETTAERFVPDPFATAPGLRVYRTGDLTRWRSDGELEFLGRIDHQVKVRGFRIELGELEALLAACPGVREAAVMALGEGSAQRLAAFFAAETPETDGASLRRYLEAKVPAFMVPSSFFLLEALPRTANGKVDRRALIQIPQITPGAALAEAGRVPPRTPVEELIASLWAQILGLGGESRIGAFDSFFELGGHSLLATQLVSRLRDVFGAEVPLARVFASPTVAGLAGFVEEQLSTGRPAAAAPVRPLPRDGELPLSFAQERLWFLEQLHPGSPLYSMPLALRLTGPLSVPALQRSLTRLVRRHETLRTRFEDRAGQPRQVIDPPAEVELAVVSLEPLAAAGGDLREAEAGRWAAEEALRPFDLRTGPLVRAALLCLGGEPQEHLLFLNLHHIIADGWSFRVLIRELASLYPAFAAGEEPHLPELPVQYADFALWQRSWLTGLELEAQLAYWKDRLSGAPAVLELPTDRPRPVAPTFRGATRHLRLPRELGGRLTAAAGQRGATLYMLLLAGFDTLLWRYSGQEDLLVASPVANRTRTEVEGLIGFFANTLVLRTRLAGSLPFAELLDRVRRTALEAYAHQDLPFERLVEELQPERSLVHNPLVQVMLALQNAPLEGAASQPAVGGLELRPVGVRGRTAKFDLFFALHEEEGALAGTVEYSTELFDDATVARWIETFERLLAGAAAAPGAALEELPALSPGQWHQIVADWNAPAAAPVAPFLDRLAAQVVAAPDAPAVVSADGGGLTYRELDERSSRMARFLRGRGVGLETPVGLLLGRSVDTVVALVAVLRAGGAYVPLDPSYPAERLAFMIRDARPAVLLAESSLLDRIPGEAENGGPLVVCLDRQPEAFAGPLDDARPAPPADSLLYVIYTSGSTGTPKGVAMRHGPLSNLLAWQLADLPGAARTLQLTPLSFDVSFQEIFATLGSGGALVVVPDDVRRDPDALWRFLGEHRVERIFLPFVALQQLAVAAAREGAPEPAGLREIVTAGEQLQITPAVAALLARTQGRLDNQYGPTEAHVVTSLRLGGPPAHWPALPPIGRPIANGEVYILDRSLRPVPLGGIGEVFLGGATLARGYLRRPDLTAERFVPSPFAASPGARLYRTGDLGRQLPDGNVQFLGRTDHQVKIRGFRVDLPEIEAVLLSHPRVGRSAVALLAGAGGDRRLVAYVVPADPGEAAEAGLADEVRAFLRGKLPEYMVPQAVVLLKSLPQTPSGKVDRRALPAPAPGSGGEQGIRHGFASPAEELLAGIWSEVLGRPVAGAGSHFFDLGGHSLLATRVTSRVREVFHVDVPVRLLFESPVLGELARRIEEARAHGEVEVPAIRPVPRDREIPLSFGQERIWFLEQLHPGSPAYHLPAALELSGRLWPDLLEESVGEVVRRHEALRTTFATANGRGVQVVAPRLELLLPLVDLGGLEGAAAEAEARRIGAEEVRTPFDVARGPLLRMRLLRLGAESHLLLLTLHHLVADGWSFAPLVAEITATYAALAEGRRPSLPELPVQYPDFAVWQREWLSGEVLDRQIRYWKEQLAGAPAVLELPADRPRPAVPTNRGAVHRFALAPQLAARLGELGRRRGSTLFMTLTAGFAALLARLSGQPDLTLGTPIANRRRADVERLIGLFMNTLALRIDASGAPSFAGLLARVREVTLGAYDHQDLPFERLVEEVVEQRSLERSPVFQVLIALQNTPRVGLELPGLRVSGRELGGAAAKFDLSLYLHEDGGGLAAALEHSLDLFDPPTAARMASQLRTLLVEAVEEPGRRLAELPLLSAAERHQLLVEQNDTEAPLPPLFTSIHACFDDQAARTPDAEAVVCAGSVLTYRELRHRADLLAAQLRDRGVGPDHRVGLLLRRSENLAVALLAVLKAGGAYVPLDPSYPADRLGFMAEDSGLTLLLTEERLAGRRPQIPAERVLCLDGGPVFQGEGRGPADAVAPGNLAYVIYTSGSTGRPKGVLVTHGAALNFFTAMDEALGRPPAGTWLAVTSISFDISVLEMLWTLCRGFRVVVHQGQAPAPASAPAAPVRTLDFSLFYFASSSGEGDRYRLLLEGARFADRHGFAAVWTPERHFHAFGGLYPNPAVLGAALAVATERIQIRAGSVVLPLQNPLRVAEEWAVVDNLSGGRVSVSFASGWHADDFVLAPERYQDRKSILFRDLELVRRLWRGEPATLPNGVGRPVEVAVQPRPIQPELPFWITAGGSPETFRLAGESGGDVLTHLLGQSVQELAQKIAVYREARRRAGHQGPGRVALMVHTFVGDDAERVREKVWKPFRDYLATSVDLIANLGRSLGLDVRSEGFSAADLEALLDHACERYFHDSALFGTPESCLANLGRFREAGVDEVACLVDFGVSVDDALAGLGHLEELRQRSRAVGAAAEEPEEAATVPELVSRHGVTHLQCTPSMARMLVATPEGRTALGSLQALLVGGEAFPEALAAQLLEVAPARLLNMYGPTETAVWSACHEVREAGPVPIGRPVANTEAYLLDAGLEPVPAGVPGELYLGGLGVTRGYHLRPELTAERFVPDPFGVGRRQGGRLYRTGDRARTRPDGSIEFLGRADHQVKIRGYRIEPGEIEAVLAAHPVVREAVVVARQDERGEGQLVAYVVPASVAAPALEPRLSPEVLLLGRRAYRWPNGMVVAHLSDAQASQLYDEIFRDQRYLRYGIELRDGDCVFDVGANIGSFTLFAHTRARELEVYSFEPIPPTFDALKANVELYGLGATVFNCGLSDRAEAADFTFYPERAGLSGRYADPRLDRSIARSIIRSGLGGGEISSGDIERWLDAEYRSETHRCELRTLSSIIAERGVERIDLLKVDVERAELDVLGGLSDEDWPKVRQVALEVDGRDHLAAVADILVSRGFQIAVDDLVVVEGQNGDEGVAVFMVYGRREGLGEPGAPAAGLGEAALAAALRDHLRESLPDYMVPAAFVALDRMPLTPNHKIDRRALPAPGGRGSRIRAAYRAPESETEQVVADIWRDLLSVDRVGLNDNFFELGGNSLMVVQLRSSLKERLGIEVSLVDLFRHPTVALLAASVEREGREERRSLDKVRSRTDLQKSARDRRRDAAQRARRKA